MSRYRLSILATIAILFMLGRPAAAQLVPNPDPNDARPRMLGPVIPIPWPPWFIQRQIFQSGSAPLPVRMNTASFVAAGLGSLVPSFQFAIQYSVTRWNEIGGVQPRLDWQNAEGAAAPQPGVINIFMAPGPLASGLGVPIVTNPTTGAASGGTITLTGSASTWTDRFGGSGAHVIDFVMHEMGHTLGLGHSCRGAVGTAGPTCNCSAPGALERAIMAGTPCPQADVLYDHIHGPMAEDVAALRTANGSSLPRVNFTQLHNVSFGKSNGNAFSGQGDNFGGGGLASAPAVAANSAWAGSGLFEIAWRGTDASDRLNVLDGFSNGWWTPGFTYQGADLPPGINLGVRGQPAMATDLWGNFLVAVNGADLTNTATSNNRSLFFTVVNPELGRTALAGVGNGGSGVSRSAEAPAVAYVEPSFGHGFWVLAFAGRTSNDIFIQTAPHTDPFALPATLAWSAPTRVVIPGGGGTSGLGVVGGLSLACNPAALSGGPDIGRCMASFATDSHRADEPAGQLGFLRTLSFSVSGLGTPSGFGLVGYTSGNKTTAATAMAYNPTRQTWHLGVANPDNACWFHNRMPAGSSSWPAISCPFTSGGLRPTVSPALVYSPFYDELQYYHAE